jgi:Uma2 family endonuclease
MSTATRQAAITFEAFCFLVKEDQKADLIDGVIYMASPENLDANELFLCLGRLAGDFIEEVDLPGKLFGSRVAFRIDDTNGPEPDLAFVSGKRLHLLRKGFVAGRPDAAFEIVCPESVDRDYRKKRIQYQKAKVPEYWIIDTLIEKVTLLQLAASGRYHEVKPRNAELHSKVLTGFWIRPDWLWVRPLPPKSKILREILSRRP